MEIIREIRDIESDKIIIKVPKEFKRKRVEILVLPFQEAAKEEDHRKVSKKKESKTSGLCGIWQDDRPSEEIIDDIYSHRTGFGNRKVTL